MRWYITGRPESTKHASSAGSTILKAFKYFFLAAMDLKIDFICFKRGLARHAASDLGGSDEG